MKNEDNGINVLASIKGKELYIFFYDDESRAELLRVLGRFVSNPELSFTWYDAAVLSQKVRQDKKGKDKKEQFSLSRRFNIPF